MKSVILTVQTRFRYELIMSAVYFVDWSFEHGNPMQSGGGEENTHNFERSQEMCLNNSGTSTMHQLPSLHHALAS